MNKISRFGAVLIMCTGIVFIVAANAWAGLYSGSWQATSDSVEYFNLTFADTAPDTDFSFFIYNRDSNEKLNIFSQSQFMNAASVQLTKDNGNYWAKLGSSALALGPSPYFGLGFDLGQGEIYEYSYALLTGDDQYKLRLGNQKILVSSDASPTPLPASLWLLGAALAGLVSVRRKLMNTA